MAARATSGVKGSGPLSALALRKWRFHCQANVLEMKTLSYETAPRRALCHGIGIYIGLYVYCSCSSWTVVIRVGLAVRRLRRLASGRRGFDSLFGSLFSQQLWFVDTVLWLFPSQWIKHSNDFHRCPVIICNVRYGDGPVALTLWWWPCGVNVMVMALWR